MFLKKHKNLYNFFQKILTKNKKAKINASKTSKQKS